MILPTQGLKLADFKPHADLRGQTVVAFNLHKRDLSFADCRDSVFSRTCLRQASLVGADLTQTLFHYADLTDADLRNAKLTHTDFRWCRLVGADLRGADVQNVLMPRQPWRLTDTLMQSQQALLLMLTGQLLPEHLAVMRIADL